MARKAAKPAPADALAPAAPDQRTIKKAEAVRQAIAAGMDTPADGVAFIKAKFGIEMDTKTFSLNKSQQKARLAKGTIKLKRGRKPKVEGYLAPPAKAKGEGELLAALETMKPLVASLGADTVKRLADLLS